MLIKATPTTEALTYPVDDGEIAGTYLVDFLEADLTGISVQKLASMALDLFHESFGIRMLDDFEFIVSTDDGIEVEQDFDHEYYSTKIDACITKIND